MKYVIALLLGAVGLDFLLGTADPASAGHRSLYSLIGWLPGYPVTQYVIGTILLIGAVALVTRALSDDIRRTKTFE